MTMGRRESCDICLPIPNVSGIHCELAFTDGWWILRDRNSTNGVKVNDVRVSEKVLRPGDTISIAKQKYVIQYAAPLGPDDLT
jgi:adenylate cyclase